MQPPSLARSLIARFSNPTLFLCVAGLVLPNALSIGALLLGIGAPPRTTAILAYATVVLIARMVPRPLSVVLFLAVAIYDAIATVALLFNLAPSELGLALYLTAELDLFASPLYAGLCFALLVLLVINVAALTLKRDILKRGRPAVLLGAAVVFAAVDFLENTSPHYHFGTLYAKGQPMDSAAGRSGFRQDVTAGSGRHVLLVVVEGLGHFADPRHQAVLTKAFDDPELRKRYNVSSGTTTYYGSTTAGELRELCDSRESYDRLLGGLQLECLPQLMAARGYRTIAMHGFTGKYFERELWYSKLGFEKQIFGEDIADSTRNCGSAFRGPCDIDLIPAIGGELRNAKQPTFFYWLTLSTHVPIAPREGTPKLGCDRGGPMQQVEVCYMSEMWSDVMSGLARLAIDNPATDILIVGDHAPPIWSKAGRGLFTPGKVTWVRLTPNESSRLSALPAH